MSSESRSYEIDARGLSVGALAQFACIMEVEARKPGNVYPAREFPELTVVDFLLSATQIVGPMDRAATRGLGETILDGVKETRRYVHTNTNLGIILLVAPLAAVPRDVPLEEGIGQVLASTTREDARKVYEAIRLAVPGGLGRVAEEDVADEPSVTLREAMILAADRDLVARQYANGFREVLGEVLPWMREALAEGQSLESAIIIAALKVLASHPDSLIVRKLGLEFAWEASRRAAEVLAAGWPRGIGSDARIEQFDDWLREDGNRRNPGTTADLIAAALFAGLRDGTIPFPAHAGSSRFFFGP